MTVHNRKEKTLNCLQNLFNQIIPSNITIKVFLTNDGCTDGTAEAISNLYSPKQVCLIPGNGNLFWNRGMLIAWEKASKENPNYYLWLNDDTILKKDAISTLIITSNKLNDNSIIIGSTTADKNSNILTYGGRGEGRKYPLVSPNETTIKKCKTFNGNIVLIPKMIYEKVGMNDSFFHHSFGDFEYGLRASKMGITNYIAPGILGYCKKNNPIPIFRRKYIPLIKRYQLLYSPLGFNPIEDFHLNRKYYSLLKCCYWFIKLHINVLFTKDHLKYQ